MTKCLEHVGWHVQNVTRRKIISASGVAGINKLIAPSAHLIQLLKSLQQWPWTESLFQLQPLGRLTIWIFGKKKHIYFQVIMLWFFSLLIANKSSFIQLLGVMTVNIYWMTGSVSVIFAISFNHDNTMRWVPSSQFYRWCCKKIWNLL